MAGEKMTEQEWAEARERVRIEQLLRENPEALAREIVELLGIAPDDGIMIIDAEGKPQFRYRGR